MRAAQLLPPSWTPSLGVLTTKPPTGPYRGAGGPEGAFFTERTIDLIARELQLDPVEVRRRNFIPREAFPYTTATGLTYDSGDFTPALEHALELAAYTSFRRKQHASGASEPLLGIEVATVVKASGGQGDMKHSSARIRVEPSGQGTFASRGLTIGGSAMYTGLQEAHRKMARIAARSLECPLEEIVFQSGTLFDRRYPDQTLAFTSDTPLTPEKLWCAIQGATGGHTVPSPPS